MKLNQAGINLIKNHEGCSLKAYLCPSGILTIGYGHTGPDVKPNMVITLEQAEQLLKQDLEKFSEEVKKLVKAVLNDNQFSALVSFAYNVGINNFAKSTLLKFVNSMNFDSASTQFQNWVYSTHKEKLPGLVNRRLAERALFNDKRGL